jgi:predicted RNA binding protein YcfA (HicA-like mRNA interferase family)
MKFGELRRTLRDDGWYKVRQDGSHEQYQHATKPGTITIAGKDSKTIRPGTLNNIMKQAGFR